MANKKTVNNTQVLVGTVEPVVDKLLEVVGGFTSEECVNAIKNKEMKAAVKAYAAAFERGKKSDWDRAKAINRMSIDIRKEFGNDGRLAEFLGLNSKSEFSKLRRAGALAIEAEKKGYKSLPNLSVVTEMLVVEGEKYGKQELLPILDYAIENETTVTEMRDYVKKFKKGDKKGNAKPDGKKRENKTEQKTAKPDAQGNVEGKINESPLPELDTALVWVNGKTLNRLDAKQREELATQLNEVLTKFGVAAVVMTEN